MQVSATGMGLLYKESGVAGDVLQLIECVYVMHGALGLILLYKLGKTGAHL